MRVLAAFAIALAGLSCGAQSPGSPYVTPVELPTAWEGELVDTTGWLQIDLTAEGRLMLDGDQVTLGELGQKLPELRTDDTETVQRWDGTVEVSKRPVLLCIDKAAPYCHAAWIFDTLDAQGFPRIWLGVCMGALRGVLAASSSWGALWTDRPPLPEEMLGIHPQVLVDVLSPGESLPAFRAYCPKTESLEGTSYGELTTAVVPDIVEIRNPMRLRATIAGTIEERLAPWTIGVLDCASDAPFGRVVTAIDKMWAAGLRDVSLPHEPATPWAKGQPLLPLFEGRWWISFFTMAPYRGLLPLVLPVADWAVPDMEDDPDDRLVLTVDDEQRVLFRSKPRSVDELREILRQAKRVYDLKMKAKGKRGFEEFESGAQKSRLFVLVCADKETPWRRMRSVLHLIAEEDFYKVQFAVHRRTDLRFAEGEAELLGVAERKAPPPNPWHLTGKLPAHLPVGPPDESLDEIRIRILLREDGRPVYRLGSKEIEETLDIGQALRASAGTIRGVVEADAEVPFKFVVAVLNQFAAAEETPVRLVLDPAAPAKK